MNFRKRILAFVGCLTILGFILVSIPVKATETSSVFYEFDSEEELLDFSPYFVEHESGTDGRLEPFSTRFVYEPGQITSQKHSSGIGSTGNIAFLTLTKYQFHHFEAELVLNFVGDESWGWGGLSFRQENVGNGWRNDGCLAFAQKEGYATLWGSERFDDTTYEGQRPPVFNKNTPFLLKVRVVNNNAVVTISDLDESVVYSTVTHTFNKSAANYAGYISMTSIDNTHAFHSLKITALNQNGEPTALTENQIPETVVFGENPHTLPVGTAATLNTDVTPVTFPVDSLLWESSDPEVAIVKGGSVVGIKPGTVTITASSPFNLELKDELNLTFVEGDTGSNHYVFNEETVDEYFIANYVRNENDPEAGNENVENHWEFGENNTIKRINLNPVADSDHDIASLYLKDRIYGNFEATMVYRNLDGEYGWIGVTSGVIAKTNRFIDDGQGFFVQREGITTVWGEGIGGPYEAPVDRYSLTGWHVMRVRVVGKEVAIYVDDLVNPAFTKTFDTKTKAGEIGLFTSGRAQYEIQSFAVDYLDDNGEIIEMEEITDLEITDKISTAKVGDKIDLNVVTNPAGVDTVYTVTTTNGNICFYNNGVLYFIGEGEVTITVECNFNKSLYDIMTVNVTDDSAKDPIYYYPTPDPEPEVPATGCTGQTLAFSLLGLVSLFGIIVYRKKS